MSGIDADFHQDTKLDSTIRINTSGVGTTMMAESNKDYWYVTLEKKQVVRFPGCSGSRLWLPHNYVNGIEDDCVTTTLCSSTSVHYID